MNFQIIFEDLQAENFLKSLNALFRMWSSISLKSESIFVDFFFATIVEVETL